jgi:hypothetical protein
MNLRTRAAALAALGALATAGLAGAGPAHAADHAVLTIEPAPFPGHHVVSVAGQVAIPGRPTGDGQFFNVAVVLWGDDPWFDDRRLSQPLHASDELGNFGAQALVHRSVLDEDPEGRDELYAKVHVTGADGRTRTVRSTTVRGSF